MKGFNFFFALTMCAIMVLGLCGCSARLPVDVDNNETPDITAPAIEVTQAPENEPPATVMPAETEDSASTTPEASLENTPAKTPQKTSKPQSTPKPTPEPTSEPTYSPRPKDPAELSAEQEQKIKEDYYASLGYEDESYMEYIQITGYFGTYNGAIALFITDRPHTQGMEEETIAGYTFVFSTGQPIMVYKDGGFIELAKAYDNGMLTKQDVRDIRWHYRGY